MPKRYIVTVSVAFNGCTRIIGTKEFEEDSVEHMKNWIFQALTNPEWYSQYSTWMRQVNCSET